MVGRPRSFDSERALEHIVETFWDQGFAGTSIDRLQEAIGIQRGSFYAAFGDKENAWRLALERYTDTNTAAALARLEGPGEAVERLGAFIRFVGDFLALNPGRGCMFLSAASQPLAVSAATQAHLARLERKLFATLRAHAPEPTGSYVIALLLGLNAMARAGMPAEAIRAATEAAARMASALTGSAGTVAHS